MDYCLSYNIPFVLESLPSAVKKNTLKSSSQGLRRLVSTNNKLHFFGDRRFKRRALIAVASADCEFSSLNTPLEPKSFAGKFLSRVLQNDLDYFHVAVGKQLEQLAADRDEAVARMNLSLASDEAALHRLTLTPLENQVADLIIDLQKSERVRIPSPSKFQRIVEMLEEEYGLDKLLTIIGG
ncbi:hypothetical protein TEA_005358 [Camellia sinensis var. sinensis]|uniref:Uncharacterized protein n=1 Tax=Camellia sinensis var. sinensis TaxID=542762 RepID=A0A4S4EMD3_CAMSN|nr:hypothetical protein TEA_005358 [Camellia sinensis var. sinensis]